MKKYSFHLLCTCVLLILACVSCKSQMSDKELENQISKLSSKAEFGTVEYTVSKIIKIEDDTWYKKLFGSKKIMLLATVHLKAGLDMENFSLCDVSTNQTDQSVVITLPHAKLLSHNMHTDSIRVVYQESSGLRREFTNEERNELLKQGEKDVLADVKNFGILEESEENARDFFTAMLRNMGFKKIKIQFN